MNKAISIDTYDEGYLFFFLKKKEYYLYLVLF